MWNKRHKTEEIFYTLKEARSSSNNGGATTILFHNTHLSMLLK